MNQPRKSGLGRGLDALLGDAPVQRISGRTPDAPAAEPRPRSSLPIEFLKPNPHQPRRNFDEAALDELAQSIRERGLLQPILVRPIGPDAFEIVAGERRWRAAQLARLHDVPVVIRELSDEDAAEIALIENVQRVDLSPLEEAKAYERLVKVYRRSPEEIAKAVGKSRSHIANSMRLLSASPRIAEAVDKGILTAGHARALIASPDQDRLLDVVVYRNLSVRDTESLVRSTQDGRTPPPAKKPGAGGGMSGAEPGKSSVSGRKDADVRALEGELAETLGLVVEIEHDKKGSGAVRLEYRNLDQLDEIVRRLTGAKI
jgi:ParB family chromosome partitioning protein